MSSSDRFGFEWGKYSEMNPDYEAQFKNWIHPILPSEFNDSKVLDAGCGMGRNSFWCLQWGARAVVAFDNDHRSVAAATENLRLFKNATILQRDIYTAEWPVEFDIVISIGVIHHLRNPRFALRNLVKSLKKKGKLILWVYSKEGNEWIVRFINPFRKHITSKLPVRLVHALSYLFSIPLWLFLKLAAGSNAYLRQLSHYRFRHIHSIVFDQLLPEIAHYWKHDEVVALCQDIGLHEYKVYQPPNKNGWNVVGIKR